MRHALNGAIFTSSCELSAGTADSGEGDAPVVCCKIEGSELDYGLCVPLAAVEVPAGELLGLFGGPETPTTSTEYRNPVELPAERECEAVGSVPCLQTVRNVQAVEGDVALGA